MPQNDSAQTASLHSSLPPGIVLDAVVAEEVYGVPVYRPKMPWDAPDYGAWLETRQFPCLVVTPLGTHSKLDGIFYRDMMNCYTGWSPSTNPTLAMKVCETLEKRGYWLQVHSPWMPKYSNAPEKDHPVFGDSAVKWIGGFTPHGVTGWNGRPDNPAWGDTFAHCVCLAAIKHMEAMKDGGEQQVGEAGRGSGAAEAEDGDGVLPAL